jgi:hypothetical protein
MGWESSPEKRARDAKVYGDPVYKRNRAVARRRANGTCAKCQHRHPALQCDHINPKGPNGAFDNSLGNLQMLCTGDGTCKCHEKKTYAERGGPRSRMQADPAPRRRMKW